MKSQTYLPLVQVIDDWPYFHDDPAAYRNHMRDYYYFMVEGYPSPFGYVHRSFIDKITWPPYWKINSHERTLILTVPEGAGEASMCQQRTDLMLDTLRKAHADGRIERLRTWTSDLVPVCARDGEHVLSITTRAGHIFGTVSYGVSLIAWTNTPQGRRYWVQRRSMRKSIHPGKLDTTVSGAMRSGEKPIAAMVREASEEASFSPQFTSEHVRSSGTISYHLSWNSDKSPTSMPHVLYSYEMELPADMVPTPSDGEVSGFVSLSLEEIRRGLFGNDFKPIVAVVWLGHFYRHGIMTPENEPHFEEICSRVHRQHHMFIA